MKYAKSICFHEFERKFLNYLNNDVEFHNIVHLTTFLDPRFKGLSFYDEEQRQEKFTLIRKLIREHAQDI